MSYSNIKVVGSTLRAEARHYPGSSISMASFSQITIPWSDMAYWAIGKSYSRVKIRKNPEETFTTITVEPSMQPIAIMQYENHTVLISEFHTIQGENNHSKKYFATPITATKKGALSFLESIIPSPPVQQHLIDSFTYTARTQPKTFADAITSYRTGKETKLPAFIIEAPKDVISENAMPDSKYSPLILYAPENKLDQDPVIIAPNAKRTTMENQGALKLISFVIPSSDVEKYYTSRPGFEILKKAYQAEEDKIIIHKKNADFARIHPRIPKGTQKNLVQPQDYEFIKDKQDYPVYKLHTDIEGRIHIAERRLDR
jgi:hypothetical protein